MASPGEDEPTTFLSALFSSAYASRKIPSIVDAIGLKGGGTPLYIACEVECVFTAIVRQACVRLLASASSSSASAVDLTKDITPTQRERLIQRLRKHGVRVDVNKMLSAEERLTRPVPELNASAINIIEFDRGFGAMIMLIDGKTPYEERDVRATLTRHMALEAGILLQRRALATLVTDYTDACKLTQEKVIETEEIRVELEDLVEDLQSERDRHCSLDIAMMAQRASNSMLESKLSTLRALSDRLQADMERQRGANETALSSVRASRDTCAAELVAAQADLAAAVKELSATRRHCSALVSQAETTQRKSQLLRRQCSERAAEADRSCASALAETEAACEKAAEAVAQAERAREDLRVSRALAADASAQSSAAAEELRAALDEVDKLAGALALARSSAEAAKADLVAAERSRDAVTTAAQAAVLAAEGTKKELSATNSRIAGLKASLRSAVATRERVHSHVQREHAAISYMQAELAQRCLATFNAMHAASSVAP